MLAQKKGIHSWITTYVYKLFKFGPVKLKHWFQKLFFINKNILIFFTKKKRIWNERILVTYKNQICYVFVNRRFVRQNFFRFIKTGYKYAKILRIKSKKKIISKGKSQFQKNIKKYVLFCGSTFLIKFFFVNWKWNTFLFMNINFF